MADREKVIKGIECCKEACGAGNCPYWNGSMIDGSCMLKLHADALALLKEHEAKTKHCNDIALEYAKEVFRLQTLLKEQPEIVQCKDCKYCSVCANGYNSYCNLGHNISYVDGFCSEAEPKGK